MKNLEALVALISGIIGIIWGFFFPFGLLAAVFFGTVALVLGIIGRKHEEWRRMAIAAIVLGALCLALFLITILFF